VSDFDPIAAVLVAGQLPRRPPSASEELEPPALPPLASPSSWRLAPRRPPSPVPLQQLLAGYNIGIESDERNRRMVAATARRVGFRLPDEEPDVEAEERRRQKQQHRRQREGRQEEGGVERVLESQEQQQRDGPSSQQQPAAGQADAAAAGQQPQQPSHPSHLHGQQQQQRRSVGQA
jgi:hypothetical protein